MDGSDVESDQLWRGWVVHSWQINRASNHKTFFEMKGIMFKEPLFHKVVAGKKTQTRRIIFPKTDYSFWSQPTFEGMEKDPDAVLKMDKNGDIICYKDGEEKLFSMKGTYALFEGDQFEFDCSYVRPRYQPNEILFLKEPYFIWEPEHCERMSKRFAYKYGSGKELEKFRAYEHELGYETYYWHSKLFMKADYARYFIQITSVDVQRLNTITKEEAIAEGFKSISDFCNTWITIHGFSSWPSNPFVWKYQFKLCE